RFSRDWSSDVCSSDLDDKMGQAVVEPVVFPFTLFETDQAFYGSDPHHPVAIVEQGKYRIEPAHVSEVEFGDGTIGAIPVQPVFRSEERRVGKECRSQW